MIQMHHILFRSLDSPKYISPSALCTPTEIVRDSQSNERIPQCISLMIIHTVPAVCSVPFEPLEHDLWRLRSVGISTLHSTIRMIPKNRRPLWRYIDLRGNKNRECRQRQREQMKYIEFGGIRCRFSFDF